MLYTPGRLRQVRSEFALLTNEAGTSSTRKWKLESGNEYVDRDSGSWRAE